MALVDNYLAVLITTVVIYLVFSTIYNRYLHPLARFPGPRWGGITRFYSCYLVLRGNEHELLLELHKKYGPVIRLTPTMLHVSDAKLLPVIYHRKVDKSDQYVTGSFGKDPMIFNIQKHEDHVKARRRIAQPYSLSNVKQMAVLIDKRVQEFIGNLTARFADTKKSLTVKDWAMFYVYDTISELAFGEKFGSMKSGSDITGLAEALHDGAMAFALMGRLYPITKLVKRTFIGDKYLIPKSGDPNGIGTIMTIRDQSIEKRLATLDVKRHDLLQYMFEVRDDNGKPLDQSVIKAETLLVLLAGSETSAGAFQAVIYHIMKSPHVYQKLIQEIDTAVQNGRISRPVITYEESLQLPYYQACIKESMRLSPSAPSILPRNVQKGGATINGHFVPEGMELTSSPWVVHRDASIWGTDVEEFRPERWIEASKETVLEWEKCDMSFGYGSRACLGRYIALMELYKAPFEFFKAYEPRFASKEAEGRCQYRNVGGLGYYSDFEICIKQR